jgi:hypothetical protein
MQTSNTTWTKSQITSENNAAREIYFEFTPALKVISGESLHFGLWASGYTGTDSAHLGWIKAFPDPINTTGLTVTPDKIGTLPVKIAIIGDPL